MTTATPSIFIGRPDTMLGVCEAIGQDLGFNANWLRVVLGAGVIFNPYAAFVTYAVLGVLVLLSRVVFPVKTPVAVAAPVAAAPAEAMTHSADARADNDAATPELAMAA